MILIYLYMMVFLMMLMFFFSINMFYKDQSLVLEWMIMSVSSINLEFLIYLDWIGLMFISIVLMISFLVLIYSMIYMMNDKNIYRFYYLVILFVFSMILMVMSPNMVSIMFGWDGLGLISFCLVIYYQNYSSYNSGLLTVLMNRVGDVMILMAIGVMMMYGSWNIYMLKEMKMIMIFILIASITKSAQIPFSSWLPMAMAAPTPISALVHSSTLVTAGIYLIIRFWKYLMLSNLSKLLMFISVITMFMSGLMANFEFDMKKIIALSTLSQLGLMMMILSIGYPILALFHLFIHAIFKSMLFMGAGIIIHLMMNNQDIRIMGKLNEYIPFTMMSIHISLLSLCGFPFMSGFYSKDLIMEMIYFSKFNFFMFILALISLMFTMLYSIRLSYYLFFGEIKYLSIYMIKEEKLMNSSMMILMILSILSGSLLMWMFFFEMVFLSIELKMLTMMMMMMSFLVLMIYLMMNKIKFYSLMYFFSSMWFLNCIYPLMNKYMLKISNNLYKSDKMWMEFYSKIFMFNLFLEYKNFLMNKQYQIFKFVMLIMIYLILIMYVV